MPKLTQKRKTILSICLVLILLTWVLLIFDEKKDNLASLILGTLLIGGWPLISGFIATIPEKEPFSSITFYAFSLLAGLNMIGLIYFILAARDLQETAIALFIFPLYSAQIFPIAYIVGGIAYWIKKHIPKKPLKI